MSNVSYFVKETNSFAVQSGGILFSHVKTAFLVCQPRKPENSRQQNVATKIISTSMFDAPLRVRSSGSGKFAADHIIWYKI